MKSTKKPLFDVSVQDELQFRTSLLRLMTVPHKDSAGVHSGGEASQLEQLQAVTLRRKSPK